MNVWFGTRAARNAAPGRRRYAYHLFPVLFLIASLPATAGDITRPYHSDTLIHAPPDKREQEADKPADSQPSAGRQAPPASFQTPQPPPRDPDPAGGGFAEPQRPVPQTGPGGFTASPLPPPPELQVIPAMHDEDIEPGEVLIVSPSMPAAQALTGLLSNYGLQVIRRQPLGGLGFVLSTFRVPPDQDIFPLLEQLRRQLPDVWLDANHRYHPQTDSEPPRRYAPALLAWPADMPACQHVRRIGLIDTALNIEHPAFSGRQLHTRDFLVAGAEPAAPDHGTGVAALLIGATDGDYAGLLPATPLYAAAVFEARADKTVTNSERVVLALNWLLENAVEVINLSLAGPPNRVLELAVLVTLQQNIRLVAAAGNNGPGAAPAYPAAYPGVVAVTAIDAGRNVYRRANQGKYIDLAAPGVDVWTATATGGGYQSGTSVAAPFVTAALALASLDDLKQQARDLGEPGHNTIFGYGLLQFPGCPE